jgi:hypothetical protein
MIKNLQLWYCIVLYCLKITFIHASLSYKYDIKTSKSVNISIDPIFLIDSYKKLDKISCMIECNLNEECYTTIFASDQYPNPTCFLFRKYFGSSEIVTSSSSDLYSKKCKLIISI